MDKFTFGFTVTVVGMGGTVLVLWFLTFIVNLLKRVFPYKETDEKEKEAKS